MTGFARAGSEQQLTHSFSPPDYADDWMARNILGMPRRLTKTEAGTHQVLKNTSYESMLVSWLMQDGWQVFLPILDHGHQTDLLISDGPQFFRIQVKTVEAKGKEQVVQNCWQGSHVDYVVYFVRNGNWGVIAPAFAEKRRKLRDERHRRFERSRKSFLREFHLI